MAIEKRPEGVHPIDWRAQRLYMRVQRRIGQANALLRAGGTVGMRQSNKSQQVKEMLGTTPEMLQQFLNVRDGGELFTTAFDQLGAHAAVLMPYIMPREQLDATNTERRRPSIGGFL